MFGKEHAPAIKGVVSGLKDIVGGGLVSGFGKTIGGLADAFGIGGVPEHVKQEGRATAAKFTPVGANATSYPINPTTIARHGFPPQPTKGEFHIWRATGEVFAVTSYAGMVPHKSDWASEVQRMFNQIYDASKNKIYLTPQDRASAEGRAPLSKEKGMTAAIGAGLLIPVAIFLVVLSFIRKKR